jgi:hypothetical protein
VISLGFPSMMRTGSALAAADVEVADPTMVRASLHIESGHLPVGTRKRLVDAVLDSPEVSSSEHVQVALPLGDTEILDRIRQRCDPADWSAPEIPDICYGS